MSKANECLICLQNQNWLGLNEILSSPISCKELSDDPAFNIFEINLVSEIKKIKNEVEDDFHTIVLERIIQLSKQTKQLNLSENCIEDIAEYLFERNPNENIAKLLPMNEIAINFLLAKRNEMDKVVNNTIISASLDIKIGKAGELVYSKKITNSPQEEELFRIANELLASKFVYPNVSLSIIIDDKIISELTKEQEHMYYTSSIDLCIVDPNTLMPEYYFELDSAWHDKPKQIEKDKMKDEIFQKAGLALIRVRKKENKTIA